MKHYNQHYDDRVLFNHFPAQLGHGRSWTPYSPDFNPCLKKYLLTIEKRKQEVSATVISVSEEILPTVL
jgi:hypothetical protein